MALSELERQLVIGMALAQSPPKQVFGLIRTMRLPDADMKEIAAIAQATLSAEDDRTEKVQIMAGSRLALEAARDICRAQGDDDTMFVNGLKAIDEAEQGAMERINAIASAQKGSQELIDLLLTKEAEAAEFHQQSVVEPD